MRNVLKVIIVVLCIVIIGLGGYLVYDRILKKEESVTVKPNEEIENPVEVKSNEFNYNLILKNHAIQEKNKNYLISPYSIEIALNMLRDGASGDTKTEIDKVIGTRKINDVTIKDKVNVANAIFMRNTYEQYILQTYKDTLKNNYDAEFFTYPYEQIIDAINNWVKDKTSGMILKTVEKINPNYVLGLVNALAMDIEWPRAFECENTVSEEFTKADGTKIDVEMMHKNASQYIKENNVEGIILPYKKEENSNLEYEFVGLIPNIDIDDYINNNLEKDLKNINNLIKKPIVSEEKKQEVHLSLPSFTYDSGVENFIGLLKNIGINKVFDRLKAPNGAEFYNMVDKKIDVYVSQAIHKSHIELTEKGTKAAAVTYIEMTEKSSAVPSKENKIEHINIKFNKPFIYVIREKNTNEMLFFGVVYEPNLWNGSTCNNDAQDKYTITFNSDGGSSVINQMVIKGGKVVKPANPIRAGYKFVEWKIQGSEKTAYNSHQKIMTYNFDDIVTSDLQLVAEWESDGSVKSYKVEFRVPCPCSLARVCGDNGCASCNCSPYTYAEKRVNEGDKVTEPFTPSNSYTFVEWQLNGKKYDFETPVSSDLILDGVFK